jgi:hypothetical protein
MSEVDRIISLLLKGAEDEHFVQLNPTEIRVILDLLKGILNFNTDIPMQTVPKDTQLTADFVQHLDAMEPIEVKTVGQMIDELSILNIRIWMLVDKAMAGTALPEEAQLLQAYNSRRNEYVRAIDRRFHEGDIGKKIYEGEKE